MKTAGQYLQSLNFFLAYRWDQKAGVFHYTKLEWEKHSSLLNPLVSYEEIEVL
jgi:hypothetical protein